MLLLVSAVAVPSTFANVIDYLENSIVAAL